jgi:hypothetical protein
MNRTIKVSQAECFNGRYWLRFLQHICSTPPWFDKYMYPLFSWHSCQKIIHDVFCFNCVVKPSMCICRVVMYWFSYVTCKLRTIEKPKQIFKNCLQCMQYEVKGLGMLMANLPGIFLVSPLPKVCPFLFWSEIQNGCTSEQSVKTLNKYFSKKLDTLLNLICTWMVIE